ncbi:MAG: autotransporter assembly complex family protein [Pseudomonadota bacterium]
MDTMRPCLSILAITLSCLAGTAQADPIELSSETGAPDLLAAIEAELTDIAAPDTLFEARRSARNAASKTESYLNSLGYFAPEISYAVAPGEPPSAQLKVEPGPLFTFDDIAIALEPPIVSEQAADALETVRTLKPGDQAIPSAIIAEEAGLIAALKASGYANATVTERKLVGDRAAGTLTLTYQLQPGARIRLGDVVYEPAARTRRLYLNRLLPFESGELFSPEKLAALSRRLNGTRFYRFVSVQLSDTVSEITAEGDEVRDVIVSSEPRERYTLTTGTSFSTSEGPGLTASLTRRDATRRGDTLTGSMTLATLERSFAVDWRIPNITAFDRSLVLSWDAGREETDAFDREAVELEGVFEVRASRALTFAFGAGSEFTREEDTFEQRDQQVLSTFAGVRLDYADDPLDATSGWRIDTRAEPGWVIGDREAQFLALNGQLSTYLGLDPTDHFILANRVRSGFVFGAALSDLPVSRRFFAGGGGSARGFEYQSVGPQDADGTPTGGRGLLEVSSELRWRRDGPWGGVVFVDAASVSADQGIQSDDLRYSAGLGVRYDTVIGPIRFDLATPIDPRDGDDPVQIYVSIGQAF